MPKKVKKAVISDEVLPSFDCEFISDSEPEVVLLADQESEDEDLGESLVDSEEETDSDFDRAEAKAHALIDDECEE